MYILRALPCTGSLEKRTGEREAESPDDCSPGLPDRLAIWITTIKYADKGPLEEGRREGTALNIYDLIDTFLYPLQLEVQVTGAWSSLEGTNDLRRPSSDKRPSFLCGHRDQLKFGRIRLTNNGVIYRSTFVAQCLFQGRSVLSLSFTFF